MSDLLLGLGLVLVFALGMLVGALLVYAEELRGYKRRRKGFINVSEIR